MSEDVKKTKGVLRMREVFEKIIVAAEADEIDLTRFAPTTCTNCIHSSKSLEESPCNKCTTALERHGRDYRPSDEYHWRPNANATTAEIQRYHKEYGVPNLKELLIDAPVRCINPRCQHGYSVVHKRGLCKGCYGVLESLVVEDAKTAEDWVLMYWLCDSEEERELVMSCYLNLYTWDRFEYEGKCLPVAEASSPDRELILYYRQTRTNQSKRNNQDPTPTEKQLSKIMDEQQLARVKEYLTVKTKR